MSDLRLAYHDFGRAVRLDELTCKPVEVRDVIARIVAAWNAAIPRNRVRILNQPRYYDLLGALRIFTADEICRAIEWYGKQAWQRARGAWCTFDAFLAEDRLTQWVEGAMEHDEKAAAAAAARQAAGQAGQAKLQAVDAIAERRQLAAEAFDALPPPRRYELLEAAKRMLTRGLQNNQGQVRLRAIALMAQQGKDSYEHGRSD
jgi:hypothetical protein